jgi:hypothetical protein
MNAQEAYKQLVEFIEQNTTWESYGYYGPLIYTGQLLEEIDRLRKEMGLYEVVYHERTSP